MPTLTYIGQAPADGTGSPVIVLRHLQRLAAGGWQIRVVAERGQDTSACERAGWNVSDLPLRRRWWPPYRPNQPLLRRIRMWLLARECLRLDAHHPPDAILGYLAAHSDVYPEIAVTYSQLSGAPCSLLIHDDAAAFAKTSSERARLRQRHRRLLARTHRAWFVSPELADVYEVPAALRRVLLPIPAGWTQPAVWSPSLERSVKIYYAGYVWPAQAPMLRQIASVFHTAGARLILLSNESPEVRALVETGLADHRSLFPTNHEALQHLTHEASGLLVAYAETIEAMPWVATSFPSKLIEYSHLGLPCAIVAPEQSSVGQWAKKNDYSDFFPPTALDELREWARALHQSTRWDAARRQLRELAKTEFSPERIHEQLETGLLRK